MFALSSITYFGLGTREMVRFQFAQTLGGNVMIIPLLPKAVAQPLINLAVNSQAGVEYKTVLNVGTGRLLEVNGQQVKLEGTLRSFPLSIMTRDTDNPNLTSGPLLAGRDLTADDRGKNVIVLTQQSAIGGLVQGFSSLEELGIGVGTHIRLQIQGQLFDYEVVGIVGTATRFTPSIANAYLPPEAPGTQNSRQMNVIQVKAGKSEPIPDQYDRPAAGLRH